MMVVQHTVTRTHTHTHTHTHKHTHTHTHTHTLMHTHMHTCADLSDEVTKEDELNGSTLLKVLKECEFFRSAASISVTALEAETHKAAHRDTETRAAEAAQSGGLGGKGGRGKGASSVVTCIVRYKSALAELLVSNFSHTYTSVCVSVCGCLCA